MHRYTGFRYWPKSWTKPHGVVAKLKLHRGEVFPTAGFIVTTRNLLKKKRVLTYYNDRGTAEPCVNEGSHAVR